MPSITYAGDVVEYHSRDEQSLHVAVNDAIRRIFGYNRWQSIKEIREAFGYPSVTEILARRRSAFENRLPHVGNSVLLVLSTLQS